MNKIPQVNLNDYLTGDPDSKKKFINDLGKGFFSASDLGKDPRKKYFSMEGLKQSLGNFLIIGGTVPIDIA